MQHRLYQYRKYGSLLSFKELLYTCLHLVCNQTT